VYERLEKLVVSIVLGFNVPHLLGFDDGMHILEMILPFPNSTGKFGEHGLQKPGLGP